MGATNSRLEEDKALKLCRERKKHVREALDGRCSLAATHVAYIQSLKTVGTALWRFVEAEGPVEPSLTTSSSASPVLSPRMGTDLSTYPSPPPSNAKFMKFGGTFAKKIEEKTPVPAVGLAKPSSRRRPGNPQVEKSPINSEAAPWDYFGLSHPVDDHLTLHEEDKIGELNFTKNDDTRRRVDCEIEESETEDEFDEPSTDSLVRSFGNVKRVPNHDGDLESEASNVENNYSIDLPPMVVPSPRVELHDVKISMAKIDEGRRNKSNVKDLLSNMKEIEHLFAKASDSGREVPRMLEANKFHFRPILSGQERKSLASMLWESCFSCGDDPSQVVEDPAQNSVKYLTWHRTASSRSSSSRNLIGPKARNEMEDPTENLFDNFCMNSGSHASTLDRLYAWERKLYDEVKASEQLRKQYDLKCKLLRELESQGLSPKELEAKKLTPTKIDKARAVVKDLHSRIRVSVHRINNISKKIEELRDIELQPQLEELIQGLRKMWEIMLECHENQFRVISVIFQDGNIKMSLQSEAHHQIAIHLENELITLSSSFSKWIAAQKIYVKAINEWLLKCVSLPQQSSRRKRKVQPPPIQNLGPPPIYVTCHVWLEKLNALPTKEVVDSIKSLASEISHLLPRPEKHQGKGENGEFTSLLSDEVPENFVRGFDNFQLGLVGFIGKLNSFAECSVKMFMDLETAIHVAKTNYGQFKPRP